MGGRLFMGNLSYKTDRDGLREYVMQHGFEVNGADIVTDRETGKSKGFGFVDLRHDGDVGAAIEAMNRKELDGRTLTVDRATARPNSASGRRER